MQGIEQQVIELRGLTLITQITPKLYNTDQLHQSVVDNILADYTDEEIKRDTAVLSLFGLLEPDINLRAIYTNIFTENVLGFYDHETDEMVIVQNHEFSGTEHMTYAHEFTHVLQDQHFNLEDGMLLDDQSCEENNDRCAAILALVEGDATLTEMYWYFEHANTRQLKEIMASLIDYSSPAINAAPLFLQEDLSFPYKYGLEFVQHLYELGGWAEVNDAYKNPPTSSEQILHPDRYPNHQPVDVSLPDVSAILGHGWDLIDEGTMGEWYTFLVLAYSSNLNARIPKAQAEQAAEGWGGDTYEVYHNPKTGQYVMLIKNVWDSQYEADEYAQTFHSYASKRFGPPMIQKETFSSWTTLEGYIYFHHNGINSTWIFSPDMETSDTIWSTLQNQ
jgi:hypothetical protein